MRQLASIQRIKALEPIENADAILKATVLGWHVVVKKGEFQVGDLCVYCEIDSLFPDKPAFEFLKPRGMRIKTVRLRGQISQGICFPLSILDSASLGKPTLFALTKGVEVTDLLGVQKYEPPVPAELAGKAKGHFPPFIPKTDETRVQVLQDLLTKYRGTPCYLTEKIDGQSVTFYLKDGEFGVCSRTLDLLDTPGNALWQAARDLDIEPKLRSLGKNFALQGELAGEAVQGNKYKLKGRTVFFFNAFEIEAYRYLNFAEFKPLIDRLGLQSVPVLNAHFELTDDIATLVALSVGKSAVKAEAPREGIVIRPVEEKTDALGRVSFKAINPEFLLKYDA